MLKNAHILIVDDEPRMCDSLKALLNGPGSEILTVNSGSEALSYLKRFVFDVVLLDVVLPDINGYEIMNVIKNQCSDTLVIIMTGQASVDSAVKSLKNGAYDYIRKPYEPEEMIVRVENAINQRKLERSRRQTEESLRENEKKYRTLFETMAQGVVYQDSRGKIISANPSAERILGLTRDQMKGRTSMDPRWKAIHEDGSDFLGETHPAMVALKTGEEVKDTIMGIFNAVERDYRWISVNAVPQFENAKEKPKEVYTTFDDVTDAKKAEEELYREKEKFRVLVEESPFGVCVIAEEGQYKYINPKFIEIFGYTPEDIPTWREWFKKVYPDREYRNHIILTWINDLKGLNPGESRPLKFSVVCKDGSQKDVLFKTVTMESGDQLMICEDITETKRLESQLRQAQKMEAIGTLAGGIAHDFNNLLMGIQGHTSLMLMGVDSSHSHYRHLKGIEEYVESATELTKQLLGFARGGKYEIKVCDLNNLVDKCSAMFGRTKKEIAIHHKYQDGLWTVEADPGQIEQVLLNLFVNAWQAMPAGGELYLKTENVILDDHYDKPYQVKYGKYVKISITDTGMGMDEASQQRMFEPFFTTKGVGRGAGLGLASAYGIIKSHDGFIDVYSRKGEGTTFKIYLPASEKDVVKEKESTEEVKKGTETILLADDEDLIIDVGEQILSALGYRVLLARSGQETIEVFKDNKSVIDMVILDMVMPGMSGGDTYNQLKKIAPDIKVLLSSGYSIDGQATEILEQGCNGFIQKPFKVKHLSIKMREILDEYQPNPCV